MQLSLARRGGFAGLRPPAFVVDLAGLPPTGAQSFERLVAAARADLPLLTGTGPTQPDRFTYVLTIGGEPTGAGERYEFDELSASPALMALVAAIQAAARK